MPNLEYTAEKRRKWLKDHSTHVDRLILDTLRAMDDELDKNCQNESEMTRNEDGSWTYQRDTAGGHWSVSEIYRVEANVAQIEDNFAMVNGYLYPRDALVGL